MKTGKISENILKRSVLGQIEKCHNEVIKGAGTGEDCAFLSWENSRFLTAVSTQTIALGVSNAAYLAVMAAANNLAASGAEPKAVTLAVTLPEGTEEEQLKELMRQAKECCRKLNIQIAGGHTEVSPAVRRPVVTATVAGRAGGQSFLQESGKDAAADMDIVVSKWIGMEGTCTIAREKEAELCRRFPPDLIALAREQEKYLSVAPEAATALKSGVYAMHDVRNGGIFGALWEISRKLGVGLCADLKQIPVRQETIEICEFYNLNPYELLSGGTLIMLARDGRQLAERMETEGIAASVIGRTNGGNDRIIKNGEETRYLEPPSPDEIYKLSFI